MTTYSLYLIEANFLIAVLTGIYFLIKSQLTFSHRRAALLMIPLFAAGLFVFRIFEPTGANLSYELPLYELDTVAVFSAAVPVEQGFTFSFEMLYWSGLAACLLFLLIRLFRVIIRLNRADKVKRDGLLIVQIPGERCFSFLHYVQLNPALSAADQEVILEHEKIHIAKKHSFDILFMELVHAANWFNPVMFLLRRELINVHEYQVDQQMYDVYKTSYMEFLLAYSLGTNSTPYLLTNQFYSTKSLIKRMDIMRTKPKNRWAIVLALPIVACSFALVSWTFVKGSGHLPTPLLSIENEGVVEDPEKMPEFTGGHEAMVKYLQGNIKYPEKAKADKISGTVYVGFIVTSTGAANIRTPSFRFRRRRDGSMGALVPLVELMPSGPWARVP